MKRGVGSLMVRWVVVILGGLVAAVLLSSCASPTASTPSGVVTTLAGSAGVEGSADGVGAAARFNYPHGITTDGTYLYVADTENHTIRKVVISTGAVTTLAGKPGEAGSDDDTGEDARFNYPRGIATDGTFLYVADGDNHTIRMVEISSGTVSTLAGTAGSPGSDDGVGAAARFRYPHGIATDGTYLYVVDEGNYTIREVVIGTGAVSTVAGVAGSRGSQDGTGAEARFEAPVGIATDGTSLFVTDYAVNTIRKVVIASKVVSTLAGTAGEMGSEDGTGDAARFRNPFGITVSGANLYVADFENCTVRKVVIASRVVSTLAGMARQYGSDDGTGAEARFGAPTGITVSGTNLYVADGTNHTIRAVTK